MAKTLSRYKVVDKHTGATVRRYRDERHATWAASKLCEEMRSPKRYEAKPV